MARDKKPPAVDMELDIRSDTRFDVLAEIAEYNRHEGVGRMFALWAWGTEQAIERRKKKQPWQPTIAHEAVIRRFLGPKGVEAILGGGVDEFALGSRFHPETGDELPPGMIYVRGSHRTDWCEGLARSASAGGKARANVDGSRGDGGRFVSQQTNHQPSAGDAGTSAPADDQRFSPAVPASSTSTSTYPDSAGHDQSEDLVPPEIPRALPARARDPAVPSSVVHGATPEVRERFAYVDSVWARINTARKRIDPDSRPVGITDNGRMALIRLLVEHGNEIRADVEHVLAVRIAEAETKRTVQWLGSAMFDPKGVQWSNAVAMTVTDARRTRAGPRAAPASGRSIREILDDALPDDAPDTDEKPP